MENSHLVKLILLVFVSSTTASWGSPSSNQYHIQTDEGPERFFRYQTDNGQFRKEKRLEDGTVIGTEAWIDASGYLRQKDYIADNEGYRILKSKTIFVGVNRPIQEAIKEAKTSPAQAGVLVDSQPKKTYFTHNSVTTTTEYNRPSSTTTTPRPNSINENPLGYDHYKTPNVFIQPNSRPVSQLYLPANSYTTTTERPVYVTPNVQYLPSSTFAPDRPQAPFRINVPSSTVETPYENSDDLHNPIAVYSPSSTIAPPYAEYGTPIAAYSPSTTPKPSFLSVVSSTPDYGVPSNSIDDDLSHYNSPTTRYRPSYVSSTTSRPAYADDNRVDVQPLFNRNQYQALRQSQPYYSPNSQYDQQLYDGVSATANGFKYFLPRQYHEEDNHDPDRRAGSFGYIDPFGIRRVIYYNTSPEGGFVHRKNNRYVGFDATPYDPRP